MPITRFGFSVDLPVGLAPVLPEPLQREAAEHRRLARPRRRASHRVAGIGRVPEAAEDVDAPHLELGRLRVLVLVDHVLVEALRHQLLGLRLHPGADERREVHARVAVEHQLVVDDLVGDIRRKLGVAQPMPGDVVALEGEDGLDGEICGRPLPGPSDASVSSGSAPPRWWGCPHRILFERSRMYRSGLTVSTRGRSRVQPESPRRPTDPKRSVRA